MDKLILNNIDKKQNVIEYSFLATGKLASFFTDYEFKIEYPFSVETVPDSVAAIPFVCNVLPIVWLTNSKLVVKQIDRDFFNSIQNIKNGYIAMYPQLDFLGEVSFKTIIDSCEALNGGSAVFFSGGLDAVQTLVAHLNEKPDLISIWGADVDYDNVNGWQIVQKCIKQYATEFGLNDAVIRSSFRKFDDEGKLYLNFSHGLDDSWWYNIKHGIGLLGHAAPYAYIRRLASIYIASSNCPLDGVVKCASDPSIDNNVRFCGAQVVHDGYELSRQDKIKNLVKFTTKNNIKVSLHVCWEENNGHNCCKCEKCYRTMVGILVEGANPCDFGFDMEMLSSANMRIVIAKKTSSEFIRHYWIHVQNSFKDNMEQLKSKPYWNRIKWLKKADFTKPNGIKPPLVYRIKRKASKFKVYKIAKRILKKR